MAYAGYLIQEMSKEAGTPSSVWVPELKIEMQRENMFGFCTYMNTFEGIILNLERRFRNRQRVGHEEIALVMSSEGVPHLPRLTPGPPASRCHGGWYQHCPVLRYERERGVEFIQTAKVFERMKSSLPIFKEVKERLGF